jgi:hypothetical protein
MVMDRLKEMESSARIDGKRETEFDLTVVYVQNALTAQRMQTVHWDHCADCQSGSRESAGGEAV